MLEKASLSYGHAKKERRQQGRHIANQNFSGRGGEGAKEF